MGRFVVRFRPHSKGRDPRPWPSQGVDLQPAQPGPATALAAATACGSSGAATNFCLRPHVGGGAGRPSVHIKQPKSFLTPPSLGQQEIPPPQQAQFHPSHPSTSSQTNQISKWASPISSPTPALPVRSLAARCAHRPSRPPLTMAMRSAEQLAPDPFLRRRVCCPRSLCCFLATVLRLPSPDDFHGPCC